MDKGFTYDYNGYGFESWDTVEKAKSMAKEYIKEAIAAWKGKTKGEIIFWGEIKGGLEVDEDGNATMTE